MKNTLITKVFAILAIMSLIVVALAPVIFSLAPSFVEVPADLDQNSDTAIAPPSVPVDVQLETE